jgi:hypothetical protein
MPGSQVSNDADTTRQIADIWRAIRELAAQNLLATAGITAKPNGITVGGSETVNGPLTVNGSSTINGPQTVNGAIGVTGPMSVTGTANFTGNTTIGGNANIAGNLTQSNSYGAMAGGPALRDSSSPGVTFTKAGTTYAQNTGMSLSKNFSNANDILLLQGPCTTTSYAYLALQDSGAMTLGSIASGPAVQSSDGTANGNLNLYGGSTNGAVNLLPNGTGKCQVYGNFAVTGTKAFLMDHPVNPDTMELMHAATESAVNGVEYWGTATLDATGKATATLPSYFEALTKSTGRNIQLTPIGRTTVQVSADRVSGGTFTIYGAPGQVVDWLVKAERQRIVDGHDELSFPAEQYKQLIGPQLPESTR